MRNVSLCCVFRALLKLPLEHAANDATKESYTGIQTVNGA
jgi:hypothetical protein